ncbi:MAG: hemolysin III family protein, partial [Gammaproteobacteria bacterium]
MKKNEEIEHYSPTEERINIASHAIGFVLSVVALVLLVRYASIYGNAWHVVSFSVFGVSLMV